MMLPTVSRRVMAKISWTPATVFDFFRDRGAELMKMLSGIGIKVLEELMLTFEASSCAMLMVVGGLWMDGRVRVRGDKLGGVWMMGGAEVYCVYFIRLTSISIMINHTTQFFDTSTKFLTYF